MLTGGLFGTGDGIGIRVKTYTVYILANEARTTYIGVTSDIERRVWEHSTRSDARSFAARYGLTKLVYFEDFTSIHDAIDREKQLKNWRRSKNTALIDTSNPDWDDLTSGWYADTHGESLSPTRPR